MYLLCLKLINYGLVWIFIGKMHVKSPNSMNFTSVKQSLQIIWQMFKLVSPSGKKIQF